MISNFYPGLNRGIFAMGSKNFINFFLIVFSLLTNLHSAHVDTVSIYSNKMQVSYRAIVVTPDTYGKIDLPVVYLLHGWSGNYRNWYDRTHFVYMSDRYQLIIVCPDGGYSGWYLDSPIKFTSQYETYIAIEVVDYIDNNYQTIATGKGRALCGLSMGGHGAVSLLCKYPDRFIAAGSISGVMELISSKSEYNIAEILGKYEQFPSRWKEHSCIKLVNFLVDKKRGIFLDCGVEDKFIKSNRQLHDTLLKLNIDHDYIERPGGHTWSYWDNALEYHILFLKRWLINEKD
jgi:S-formylglutathione hydrolase FrmB